MQWKVYSEVEYSKYKEKELKVNPKINKGTKRYYRFSGEAKRRKRVRANTK